MERQCWRVRGGIGIAVCGVLAALGCGGIETSSQAGKDASGRPEFDAGVGDADVRSDGLDTGGEGAADASTLTRRDGSATPPAELPEEGTMAEALDPWASGSGMGLGVVVSHMGEVVLGRGWGQAREGEKAGVDTIFEVGSVSKMFTAALMHDAVQRGEVRWGDPVSTYLPDFALGSGITVERLIRQTTGLFSYTSSPEFQRRVGEPWTPAEIRALSESVPLRFSPGSAFDYSNSNYFLAGLVLESTTGKPFEALLRERITGPLGMERTGMCDVDPWTSPRAQGYVLKDGAPVAVSSVHMSGPFAAGGVCSTPREIGLFAREYYGGRWFSVEALSTPERFGDGLPSPYTYATFVGRTHWHDTLSHGGNIDGFTSSVVYWPDHDLILVVLANRSAADLAPVKEAVLAVVTPVERPTLDQPLRAEELVAMKGTYTATGLPPIRAVVQGGELRLEVQGSVFGLRRVGEADFETQPPLLRVRFVEQTLEVEQNGILITLRKE